MEVKFDSGFPEQLRWWLQRDSKIAEYIESLMHSAEEDPFHGLGDPRLIKEMGRGVWGRHIAEDHYLIYVLERDRLTFLSCRAVRF